MSKLDGSTSVDELDRRLLEALSRDGRMPVIELARHLGVARATAQARLDRLIANGVIIRFIPEVDAGAVDFPVLAFTTLETTQGDLDALCRHLAGIPEVLEVHTISGIGDVLCRVVARSNEHLQSVIGDVLSGPTINRTTTNIVLSTGIRLRPVPLT
jgi:DNA-binding Lrp family transcriptional regulator